MRDQEPPQSPGPPGPSGLEPEDQYQLADFLRRHRETLLEDWERAVRMRHPEPLPDGALLRNHMPEFLDRLADAAEQASVEQPPRIPEFVPGEHGLQRLELGFEPGEVALEYGLLRLCILRRMERSGHWPGIAELELLDEAIDQGIITAITQYAHMRERMLQSLERVSQAALESEDLDTFLPRLLKVLMETAVAVDGASILLREGEQLRLRAAAGLGAEEALAEGISIPLDLGLTGKMLAGGQPRSVRSAATHPQMGYEPIRELGLRAVYSVPLQQGETLVGVAHMASRTVFDFSESDKLLFRAMVTRATGFIVQAELAERERLIRAEAQHSLAQLDTLLKASPVGIAFLDQELRYLRINETLASIHGHSVEYHRGKRIRDVVPVWVADLYEPLFRRILETGQPVSNHEFMSHGPDCKGPARYWLGNYYPVRSESGEVLGLGCVVVDITPQKAVEAELRRSGELREQLIGVLGHDLRNPLNAISASAFLLQRTEDMSDGAVRAVERIRKSAGRMARMLNDILDFARSSVGGGLPVLRERVNLHDIVRGALEELQVTNPGQRFELEVRGDGWGWWDADRLAQVVGNLLSNALHHGRPDTPVRVEVREDGDEVLLSVHNEGEPIPAELQATLFQPFRRGTTGKAATRSVGLGLYIVRQVAHAHGGEVEVRSVAGEGTTFTVHLPSGTPSPPV
ncbi:ATP-binding protein [Archangium violaceum]|uniref:ATP-binding protein n=1 Tax=Archangium violaceum TaxID=83451 RepID=UPI002B3040A4|nr:ATP-binding protein [Archangium gephyra]